MSARNKSKNLLVTGASQGIGRATALLAAEHGWRIVVNYRNNAEAAQQVVDEIRKSGGSAKKMAADVSDESQVVELFAFCQETFGPLDGLVNNAGILESQMKLIDMDGARLDRVFAVNVRGSFLCAREAVRQMSTKQGGRGGAIVNVSSAASRLGAAGEYIDYAASKGAVDTLTIGLANEVAEEGIRVNAVRPGFINTDIHARGGQPDRLERIRSGIPLKRAGEPGEVAQSIVWLLSDQASYCTGMFIDCAGGR